MAIEANTPNDWGMRGATNTTLPQFQGVPRQLVVNIDDGYRPVIMDGTTLGGKFKCASSEELSSGLSNINTVLTEGLNTKLNKTEKAESAKIADSILWSNVQNIPDNVSNAISYTSQTLTDEQKEQLVTNLDGTFLPMSGGKITGNIVLDSAKSSYELGFPYTSGMGSLLALRSITYSDAPGGFDLIAKNNDTIAQLSGRTDGSLFWNGNHVIQQVSFSSSYVRFSNGIQIVFGSAGNVSVNNTADTSFSFPFPVPFSETPVAIANIAIGYRSHIIGGTEKITTTYTSGFYKYASNFTNKGNIYVLAIGRWK